MYNTSYNRRDLNTNISIIRIVFPCYIVRVTDVFTTADNDTSIEIL